MRIHELNLIRYGKFTDRRLELPARERDIHFIVGPNEAGKSTLRAAIGDWLFGFPARAPRAAFLHPMPELRLGGVLEDREGKRPPLAFHRSKGNKNTLRTPEDGILPDASLVPWLGSLDDNAFRRMFALDHDGLVKGGADILSASGDLGQLLFQSASGLEHLGKTLKSLEVEADALWGPRKSGTRAYYQALEAFEQAQAHLKQNLLRSKDWKAQHTALNETAQHLEDARQQHARLQARIRHLQCLRRVQPLLSEFEQLEIRAQNLLDETGSRPPRLPEDAAQTLNRAREALARIQPARLRHQAMLEEQQTILAGLHCAPDLLERSAEIQEMEAFRLQYRAHRTDILKRQEEIRIEKQRLRERATGLQWPETEWEDIARRVPAKSVRTRLQQLLLRRAHLLNRQQQTAADALRQRQLIEVQEAEWSALEEIKIEAELASALEQALTLGDTEATQEKHKQQCRELREALEAALTGLGAWRATPAELLAMMPPDTATLQQVLDEQRHALQEEKALQATLQDKKAEIEQGRAEIEQLVRTFNPVSAEQVQAARTRRDALWQQMSETPTRFSELQPAFEEALNEADRLADERTDRLQHDAERHSRSLKLELATRALQTREAEAQTCAERLRAWQPAWEALLGSAGLPGLPPELILPWLKQRETVLDLSTRLRELEQAGQDHEAKVLELRQRLWFSLEPSARLKQDEPPSLAVCVKAARVHCSEAEQTRGRRELIGRQLQEARAEWTVLEQSAQRANEDWQAWVTSWQDALLAAGYPDSTLPDRIEAELESLAEIEQMLEKIRALQTERVDRMQADLDGLETSTQQLARQLGLDPEGQSAEMLLAELMRLLKNAEQAQADWKRAQEKMREAREALAQMDEQEADIQAQCAPLLSLAACQTLEELGTAIAFSDRQRQLDLQREKLQADLREAGDGLSREILTAELSGQPPGAIAEELLQLESQSQTLLNEIAHLSNRFGAQKSAFDRFAGSEEAAVAEACKQEALARMVQAVEQYWPLQLSSRLLRWSMDRFRENRQGPMLARASACFRTLTLQSFSRLLVEGEGTSLRLIGVREDGRTVEVDGLSEGTRDQLYLALRLAALDMQREQGLVFPLIADDLFINFDDTRTAAGFEVLGELSRHTQVLFLTHHDHLVPLARKVLGEELNVVML